MSESDAVVQKVSSGVDVLVNEMRGLRHSHEQLFADFALHRRDDREDFSKVFQLIETNRKDRNEQFDKMLDNIVTRLNGQDKQIKDNDALTNRARGASLIILAILGFLGSVLLATITIVLNHVWTK